MFDLWVNWENRVISFTHETGLEELKFQTHEEKFKFAIDRGMKDLEFNERRGVTYEIRI